MTQNLYSDIDVDEKRALFGLLLIAAKQHGFIMKEVTDLHHDRLLQLYRGWGGDGHAKEFKPFGAKLDLEHAAANFTAHLEKLAGAQRGRAGVAKDVYNLTKASVSITIPLGTRGGAMTFLAEGEPTVELDHERMKEMFEELSRQAIMGFEQFIEHPPMLPTRNPYQAESGSGQDTFEFTSIVCKSEGGKRGFFVKGGKYVKWGVRVFPPVLSKAGIDPASITDEKFIAGVAIFTKKGNGDPDLVVSMTVGVGL